MEKILALDVATKCGWCTETASGTWDLSIKRDESSGFRLIRFKAKLKEIIELEKITIVVFERTAGHHKAALIVQAELHGIMKSYCEEAKIQYRAYSAKEIKLHATGKGSASKETMMKACKEKYGIEPIDDNHADAVHLYHLLKEELGQ